jgi:hypothetical protein
MCGEYSYSFCLCSLVILSKYYFSPKQKTLTFIFYFQINMFRITLLPFNNIECMPFGAFSVMTLLLLIQLRCQLNRHLQLRRDRLGRLDRLLNGQFLLIIRRDRLLFGLYLPIRINFFKPRNHSLGH